MKIKNIIYLLCIFFTAFCYSKTDKKSILNNQVNEANIQRNENETIEQFVERVKPENSKITHNVISTKWNSTPVIIVFYEQSYKLSKKQDPDQNSYQKIIATIFVENQKNNYTKLIISSFDNDGGPPKIETVLFANADQDQFKELIIIVSWEESHFEISGTIYETFVYDNLKNDKKIDYLNEISKKLKGGCDCSYSDGRKNSKAKIKTAKNIKSELLKLSYKNL